MSISICTTIGSFTFHMYNNGSSVQDKCVQFCNSPPLSTIGTHFSRIFQHISIFSRIFEHISIFSRIFEHISTFARIFQHILTYSRIFQHISTVSRIFQHFSRILSSHFTIHTWPTKHISKFYKIGGSWENFIFITRSTFHIILASDTRWNVSSRKRQAELLCVGKSWGCRIFGFEWLPNSRLQTYPSRLTHNCGEFWHQFETVIQSCHFFIFASFNL